MAVSAVLVDTVSIQQYIFAGNRLKENLGASELLLRAYDELLQKTLHAVSPGNAGVDSWKDSSKCDDFSGGVKVGYIGGGNMLLLFESSACASDFIRKYSRLLLEHCPGLRTAFGVDNAFEENGDCFQASMNRLHQSLRTNKNNHFPLTTVFKHGITADCPYSGESLEKGRMAKGRMVSAVSFSKYETATDDSSTQRIRKTVSDIIGEKYDFTDDLGGFGQLESKSYVAVVHVDGNKMGQSFKSCQSLAKVRELSQRIENVTFSAFRYMVRQIVQLIENETLGKDSGFKFPKDQGGKTMLPLRPIILGGDDITFVCEGRLGVYLAETFLKGFLEHGKEEGLSACAGVAVVKTKYPFHKAYEMAEQLCSKAKEASRKEEGSSYLDFLISAGGYTGSLGEIRGKHFSNAEGSLNYGPYRFDDDDDDHSIAHLKQGLRVFNDRSKWAKGKVMAFREELHGSNEHARAFLKGQDSPPFEFSHFGAGDKLIWNGGQTPYFEMIDLLDFYPEVLLQEAAHATECKD